MNGLKNILKRMYSLIISLTNIAQLALQGPLAEQFCKISNRYDLSEMGSFEFKNDVDILGKKALVSRTGYTGEDGFEIYCERRMR